MGGKRAENFGRFCLYPREVLEHEEKEKKVEKKNLSCFSCSPDALTASQEESMQLFLLFVFFFRFVVTFDRKAAGMKETNGLIVLQL